MKMKFFDWNKRDPLFEEVAYYVVETQSVDKLRLKRMIDYIEQFSHLQIGPRTISTMRTTCSLIDIVLENGNESRNCHVFPYRVNMHNYHRFLDELKPRAYHGRETIGALLQILPPTIQFLGVLFDILVGLKVRVGFKVYSIIHIFQNKKE